MFYYIFTVGVNDIHSKNPGELYLDNFFEYTNDTVDICLEAKSVFENELIKTTQDELFKSFDIKKIINAFQMIKLRSGIQNTIICKCKCEYQIEREVLETLVKYSTKDEIKKYQIKM